MTETNFEEGSVEEATASLLGEPKVEDNQTAENESVEATDETTPDVAVDDNVQAEDTNEENITPEVEEPAEPQTFTVKVDGKEEHWTLDQLTRSASGQSYIQKKMGETAQIRKEAEEIHNQLKSEREQLQQAMETYKNQLAQNQLEKPDIALAKTDPIKYMTQQAEYNDAMEKQKVLAEETKKLQVEQTKQNKQVMEAYLKEQATILQKHIPEFSKSESATALRGKLISTGGEYGFTEQEIASIVDNRAIRILNDARKWQELQKSQGKIEEKVSQARPLTIKAGSKQVGTVGKSNRIKEATAKLQKSGSVEDGANWLLATS